MCVQQNHITFKAISQNPEVTFCHQAFHTNYRIITFSQQEQTLEGTGDNSHTLSLVSPHSLLSQILQSKLHLRP